MNAHSERNEETLCERARHCLLLLHIPKTAGTSLRHVVMRRYAPSQVLVLDGLHPEKDLAALARRPPARQQELKFISGHIPWGAGERLPMPSACITCLRDPLERMVSLYFYSKRTTDHYLHQAIVNRSLSLDDFLCSELSSELLNGQTRLLAGVDPASAAPCTEEMFQTAIRHLDNDVLLAGLSSHFDETLLLLARKMGWRTRPFYRALNVRKAPSVPEQISPRARQAVLECNRYEQQLYQYVSDRFAAEIRKAGPAFVDEVRRFRRMNAVLQPLIRLKWAMVPAKRWYAFGKTLSEGA